MQYANFGFVATDMMPFETSLRPAMRLIWRDDTSTMMLGVTPLKVTKTRGARL